MRSLAGCLLVLAACGCQKARPPAKPVTMEEARAAAASIDDAVKRGDEEALAALFDVEAFHDRVTDAPAPFGFKQGFRRGSSPGTAFARELVGTVKREGSYRLLRVRTVDGAPRPLFRVVTEGGSNYHEYELVPDRAGEGRARIVDVYVFNSGEPLSATLRRLFVRGASEEPGFLGRLAGKKPGGPFTEHLEEIKRMNQARAKGDAAGWMAIYRALPDELQQDRSFLLMRVAMASRLGEAEYEAAAAALLAQAPDDPALSLVQIDGLFFQKKYAKALKVVERLDARLGGDPFLDALAANLLLEQGKPAAAKQRAERAVRAEPDLITGWWALVNVSLRTRDFDETARLLLHIERALHVPIGDLSDLDAYHGFVASEAYRAWQESRSVE